MIGTRILPGGGSSFVVPTPSMSLVGLMNATIAGAFQYVIGPISSVDGGATITPGAGPVITTGVPGNFDDVWCKDPALVWDGSQFVCYYAGYDGDGFRIGRATASSVTGTWTKHGDPLIGFGGGGSPFQNGVEFPAVIYDPDESPPWKLWALQYPFGADHTNVNGVTVGFWDSTDGLDWDYHGTVVPVGTGWYNFGVYPSAAIKVGSEYHLFVTGFTSNLLASSGFVTCTDPADDATYTTATELPNYAGNLTLGAWTWRSNIIRTVLDRLGGNYYLAGTVWNPTPTDTEEATWAVETTDLTDPDAPSGLVITPPGSGWYGGSAENPSLIEAP